MPAKAQDKKPKAKDSDYAPIKPPKLGTKERPDPAKEKNVRKLHPTDMGHYTYDRTHVAVTPREVICNTKEAPKRGGRVLTHAELDAEIKAVSADGSRDFEVMDFLIDLKDRSQGVGSCRWGGGTLSWAHPDVIKRFCNAPPASKPAEPKPAKQAPIRKVKLTCKRCGNTEQMDPKYGGLIALGVCSVDCGNLLKQGSIKKKVAKPEPGCDLCFKPIGKQPVILFEQGHRRHQKCHDNDPREEAKENACVICGDKFWGSRTWGDKHCSATCYQRAFGEAPQKNCPKCGKVGDIDKEFGWRTMNGKRKPQSRCKKCR